jgi:hypothetical protein
VSVGESPDAERATQRLCGDERGGEQGSPKHGLKISQSIAHGPSRSGCILLGTGMVRHHAIAGAGRRRTC